MGSLLLLLPQLLGLVLPLLPWRLILWAGLQELLPVLWRLLQVLWVLPPALGRLQRLLVAALPRVQPACAERRYGWLRRELQLVPPAMAMVAVVAVLLLLPLPPLGQLCPALLPVVVLV